MTRVAVLGTGSWGTAFSLVLADAGGEVRMWGRRAELCAQITSEHRNAAYLPGVDLPAAVSASTDAAEVLHGAEVVVLAVPAQTLRGTLTRLRASLPEDAVLVSLAKGIEAGTNLRMSQVVVESTGHRAEQVAVVSGPNLAREIAERQPTTTVVASSDLAVADRVAEACATPAFRPYTHHDVVGVEVGGAVKNVVGLAVGMAEGLGYGDNTKASIITRGLVQTSRLAVALGAESATLSGLAGMGDLVATCASPLSRNHQVGVQLGRGRSVAEAERAVGQTAEGVRSASSVLALARSAGVAMSIVEQVVAVVEGEVDARTAAARLLARDRKHEMA